MLTIVGGDSKQETYLITHTTSGIYILMSVHGGSAAAIMNVFPAPQHENMPRRTLGPSCQANMTDRHFSSSAMIKMMGSSLKDYERKRPPFKRQTSSRK